MKSMVKGYNHRPGEHCGSSAMRGMLQFYCGMDLSEPLVFGLGSGIEMLYLHSFKLNPEIVIFGRSATLECDLAQNLGFDYSEAPEADNNAAWEKVREEVKKGCPVVVCTDTFYLDHREYKYHFPFNRFVVVGFDDELEKAYIHERISKPPQAVSYQALIKARNPAEYPIFNLWGKFGSNKVKNSLEEACLLSLRKTAKRMMGLGEFERKPIPAREDGNKGEGSSGLDGIKNLRDILPTLRVHKNADWILSYMSQTIERFGTGGGNFRKLYAAFLEEANNILPDVIDGKLPQMAARSASLWTSLSQAMYGIVKDKDESYWKRSSDLLEQIVAIETGIFEVMMESSHR